MKKYHISHNNDKEKADILKLYLEVMNNGKPINSEWDGDYLVNTYEYNDKIYELWSNMEYGIASEIVEYEKGEKDDSKN